MRLILFIALLFAEAWSIAQVSARLGGLLTFVLLLFIAAAGVQLIQRQGFKTVGEIQSSMQREELPALAMLDGLIVFVAGVLLIFPGFISDITALALLFGGLRRRLTRQAEEHLARQHPEFHRPTVIEGDYQTIDEPQQQLEDSERRNDRDE